MLTALRRGAAVVGSLVLLVTFATMKPGDPGGASTTVPTQRHTASAVTPAASATPTGSAAAEREIRFTSAPEPNPPSLERFYTQEIRWAQCPDDRDLDCARVTVPIDHAQPSGATIAIALRRLPAYSSRPRGTLFVNPGGPGGSGTDFVQEPDLFGDDLRDAWNVVGFDPRGIGDSSGFDCLTDEELDAMYAADPTPPTTEGRDLLAEAAAARAEECLQRGGALAANMGSEAVAADLDILREVVGDERLNYYGVSYGTLIGAIYADQFTSRVGLMVLDSAVSPDALDTPSVTQRDVDANARHWGAEFDALFADFVEECGDHCVLGEDVDKASAAVIELLDSLESVPLPTDFPSLPQVTEGWAVTAIGEGLLDRTSWPYLVDALEAAIDDGDGTELAWFAMVAVGRDVDGSYPGSTYGKSHLPVTCADWPVRTWAELVPSRAVLEEHPLFGRIQPPLPSECAGWKGELRSNLLLGAEPATPVLVVGNEHDPVTPIADSEYVADMLVGSRFVTVDAAAHGAYAMGNACVDRVVEDYLARARAPRDGLECPAD
ncbi:alpha/beta hydrolase [Intrasporangium sp. DVR]|uniref:alpha/beta hydrolase n=1 Tax=Intrasporangium sp. DVR TaxID=3127867 RepID=UPI00313A5CCE